MKAAAISSYGSLDVLRVIDMDDSQASRGKVRVRIKSDGVQPFDCVRPLPLQRIIAGSPY